MHKMSLKYYVNAYIYRKSNFNHLVQKPVNKIDVTVSETIFNILRSGVKQRF